MAEKAGRNSLSGNSFCKGERQELVIGQSDILRKQQ
jgi:hypothetical protein